MPKTGNNGAAKATKTAPKAAVKTNTMPATDAPMDGEVAKTTKARATSVPPKANRTAGLAAAPSDIPTPMTTGVAAEITDAEIREHAYHLWLSGEPGDQDHHWHTAAQALRGKRR